MNLGVGDAVQSIALDLPDRSSPPAVKQKLCLHFEWTTRNQPVQIGNATNWLAGFLPTTDRIIVSKGGRMR